jgi:hypothetical protein
MTTQSITVARIYLREGEHLLGSIVDFLHDEEKVLGITYSSGLWGLARTEHFVPAIY